MRQTLDALDNVSAKPGEVVGRPAPVRRYLPKLIELITSGAINLSSDGRAAAAAVSGCPAFTSYRVRVQVLTPVGVLDLRSRVEAAYA